MEYDKAMMTNSELLNREQLYRKLNIDIKKQTKSLLKQVEAKIDCDDNTTEDDNFERWSTIKSMSTSPSEMGLVRPSSEGLIRILQAKVKVLREQLKTLQSDYTKRTDEWKSLKTEMVKVEDESFKTKQNLLSVQELNKKQEKLIATITGHLQVRDRENSILRKQIESMKRELKQQEINSNGNEVRLNRSLEEIEKLKDTLKKLEMNEKEKKELSRVREDELNKTLMKVEKQKLELMSSFKKQLYLINNLKKQQCILETSRLVSNTEEEFMKLLNWDPDF